MTQEPVQLDLLDWLAAQAPCPTSVVPGSQPSDPRADFRPVHLTRVDPSRNMSRFTSMALVTSLFGECGVVRQRGRLGSQGRSRTDWCEGPGPAEAAGEALRTEKQRRGYVPKRGS